MLTPFDLEPDEDRWRPFDPYPAGYHPTFVAGQAASMYHARAFRSLCEGFDRIGVP